MATNTISAEQLAEGSVVLVRGRLGFSRLSRLIEGAELATSDNRKIQNGMNAVGKPHTTATITEAEVIPKDAANPTTEETFVSERRYVSNKRPETGLNYSIDSKGSNLPIITVPDENGKTVPDDSGKELASGLDVTLALRVYKPKNYAKRGLSLDQVVVNEEVRYYTADTTTEELVARGLVSAAQPQAVAAGDNTVSTNAANTAAGSVDESTGTVYGEDGLGFPAPAQAPSQKAQPSTQPAQAQPAAATVTAQPAQAQEVQPQSEKTEDSLQEQLARLQAENAELKDYGSAVGAPAAVGNPWQEKQESQQAGITPQS
ncbi:hypothetical protein [Arthrobacter castelli]|uniref:hypothetical protein n=1 Tax=Arthrobacter castelli TaxID=271431 RepID=UPI0004073725|nr:hypothetical protein [Arthrobacter castelli]